MLYFAYGSNLDWDQIRERCPSVRFECVASVKDHRLAFTRFSTKRQCGSADILPNHGDEVWGVVYQIDEPDFESLDESEGYRQGRPREENAYERVEIRVWRDGKDDARMSVWTYGVVAKLEIHPKPSAHYKRLIVEGARRWNLPAHYVEQLETIEPG